MRTHCLHFVFWALLALSVRGAETTPEQASAAVRGWIAKETPPGLSPQTSVAGAETRVAPDGATRIHVVTLSNGGYVLVPADDAIDPILVFSASGPVPDNDLGNPFWVLVCADVAARGRSPEAAAHARERWTNLLAAGGITTAASRPRRSFAASPVPEAGIGVWVEPFLLSRWGQTTHDNTPEGIPCFNYFTPSNYPCGCIVTAGAQIMRHWRWPQDAVEGCRRQCYVDYAPFMGDMRGGVYDWDAMPLDPTAGVTDGERILMGGLMRDLGVSLGMNWTERGGSAAPSGLALRLTDTFHYTNALAAVFETNGVAATFDQGAFVYSLEAVKSIVVPNCNIRAPTVMAISGTNGSHAVVVDGYGYSEDAFCMHVNFGWSGANDAWFFPPAVGDFTAIDAFLFNIFPDASGSIVSGRVLDASGNPVAGALVSLSSSVAGAFQRTHSDENGIYGFIAEPGEYQVSAWWGEETWGGASGATGVVVAATTGNALVPGGVGEWYVSPPPSLGNTYDADVLLPTLESVPTPVLEPGPCVFHPSTNVTIRCADPGATICYTLDGTSPTLESNWYRRPIQVDETVTIKARAFAAGKNPSPVAETTYVYDMTVDAPAGDYFSAPIVLSGGQGLYEISDNGNYSVEANEPLHTLDDTGLCYPESRTVWFVWTPPQSGTLTIRTFAEEESFVDPTAAAVYRGDTVDTAERLAFGAEAVWDDDDHYVTTTTVPVERGEVYHIVGMILCYEEEITDWCSFSMAWSLQRTETASTPVPVPYAWLSAFPSIGDASDDAYEALAHADSDGDGFPNWAEYAANSDPASGSDFLQCDIGTSAAGALTVTVYPETAREGFPRVLQGKVDLNDQDWTDLSAPAAPYRFFRYVIRLSP